MPDWLIERGIGEVRTALVESGRIVEARIVRDGIVEAGSVLAAKLVTSGRNAIAVAGGAEYLLPKGPAGVTEGAPLAIEVTREALGGGEPWKRPLARLSDEAPRAAAALSGRELPYPAPRDEFAEAGWHELLDEARSGIIGFAGGELRVSPTPAMTLIDVDGTLAPADLALAGAAAAGAAIRRHGIGGSIGVDLPTIRGKAARLTIAEAVDALLPPPFERTAVNGFGFLQIVRPRRFASLFELAADRASFEARALLRLAGRDVGAIRLAGHPAVIAVLDARREWIAELSRQVGGAVSLCADPALGMAAGYAERP